MPDSELDRWLLGHISDCGLCRDGNYQDAETRLAECMSMAGNVPFAQRLKRRLRSMSEEGKIVLTTRGSGIIGVSLPGTKSEPQGTPDLPMAEPAPPVRDLLLTPGITARAATIESDLPPMQKAYRILILSWLAALEGRVVSPTGTMSSQFREFFGIPPTLSARSYFSGTLLHMETTGEVTRQRTANPTDETSDPDRWHRSRKTFAIVLRRPMAPGDLVKLAEALDEAKAKVGVAVKPAAKSQPQPSSPDERTPTHDVLIANEADRLKLADRIYEALLKAHTALRAAIDKGARRQSESTEIYALSMSKVLREAGFERHEADEITWYLKLFGFTTLGFAGGKLWWWKVSPEAPKREAVVRQIVRKCNIYQPRRAFTEPTPGTVSPAAYPAYWRDTGPALGDHQVGEVRVSNANGTSTPAVPSAPKPAPRPAPPTVKARTAPAVTFSPPAAVQEETVPPPNEPSSPTPPSEAMVIHELIIAQLTDQVATLRDALAAARQELTSTKDRLTDATKVGDEARRQAEDATAMVQRLQSQLDTLATPAIREALELLRASQDT